ncbi:DUF2508 family protein [Paenibacillus whitsoniae]|nr:DUF2508 family protein [Paenibacillus whitsoniae]
MRPELLGSQGMKKPSLKSQKQAAIRDKQLLIEEIHSAHLTWQSAQAHFEFAVEKDQIDYAIYALEAAEKRFEMLIKQAKKMGISLIDSDRLLEG